MSKRIELTHNQYTVVDDEDYDELIKIDWFAHKKESKTSNERYYVQGNVYINGHRKIIYMHRYIMGDLPDGMVIDHINGDSLDNRRCNLRFCTRSQNNMNSVKRCDSTNKYKGVHFKQSVNKWRVRLCINNKRFEIGTFNTEEEAALKYNEAALKHYGEFARLNIIN